MPVEPGQLLLHYRLVEKIGEGGMGVVWKAVDTTLDRPVAVKLLPPAFAEDPERLARFEREAKLLAALNHPNIGSIFSVHRAQGEHFIALELIEGQDLAERTAQGPLTLEDSLQVCLSIAEALEAAHQAGVVHRDLKPANVKLSNDGKVKVLDFGLAKAVESKTASDGASPTFAPTVTSAGTRDGVILGTAAYMSPEQARGKPLDQRTDLWSFGCVLYECLTGRVLFRGETVSDSLAAILRKDPDWSLLPAETPPAVRTLLRRCLTRDASRRLHSASDARIELLEAIEHPGAGSEDRPDPAPGSGKRWIAVAGLLLALGLALGWGIGSRFAPGSIEAGVARLSIPTPAALRMLDPKFTPDGTAVVFRGRDLKDPARTYPYRLYVRRVDQDALTLIEGAGNVLSFSLSPDGRSVAFVERDVRERRRLMRVPLDQSAPPQHLADFDKDLRDILWVDEQTIVAPHDITEELWKFPATGGQARARLEIKGDPAPYGIQARDRLPDGRHLLVRAVSFETGDYQQYIGVLDTETGALNRIVDDGSYPTYLPTGYVVYGRTNQLMIVGFDAAKLETIGTPRVVLGGVWAEGNYTSGQASVSREGHLVYLGGDVQGSKRTLAFSDREGNLTPWSDLLAEYNSIHVSPDGKRLAAQVDNAGQGDALLQIRLSDVDNPRFVTVGSFPGFDCSNPRWSADSSMIVYKCLDDDLTRLYVVNVNAPESQRRILERPAGESLEPIGFTADGAHVVARRRASGGETQAIVVPADPLEHAEDELAILPVEGDDLDGAAVSPDGKWILYFSSKTGRREMFLREIVDATKLGPRLALGIDRFPGAKWSHVHGNGSYELLLFTTDETHVVTIETKPALRVGTPRDLGMDAFELGLMYTETLPDSRLLHIIAPDSENGSSSLNLILNWARELESP